MNGKTSGFQIEFQVNRHRFIQQAPGAVRIPGVHHENTQIIQGLGYVRLHSGFLPYRQGLLLIFHGGLITSPVTEQRGLKMEGVSDFPFNPDVCKRIMGHSEVT